MGDSNAAQDHLVPVGVTVAEGMNVEPCSYTRFSRHGFSYPFCTLQVVVGRYLEVVLIARDK